MTQPATPARNILSRAGRAQAAGAGPAVAPSARTPWGFLEIFILGQVVLPALLYLPGTQPLRLVLRVAPFGLALVGLFVAASQPSSRVIRRHPVLPILLIILVYLFGMIGMPSTNTLIAGAAQVVLYAAVMSPVFWAPLMVRSKQQLQRIMAILLICATANAVMALLQVYDPNRFLPREFSTVAIDTVGLARYIGPDGQEIIRPPGFSDTPGAVCSPASIAALLGLIFGFRPIGFWKRLLSFAAAFAGIAAIFLSHVRTSILIVAGMYLVYCWLLIMQRKKTQALTVIGLGAGILVAALTFATVLGGQSIVERFGTLFEESPTEVYYKSARGYQLQYDTKNYLTQYPLGAGLGRWGMMRLYFGSDSNWKSPPLWAELQWPAWALDGGIVLLSLYMFALLRNTLHEYRAVRSLEGTAVTSYAAMIFAANMGVLALVFGFTPFTTQVGLQYWFLAGVLHGVAQLPRQELT